MVVREPVEGGVGPVGLRRVTLEVGELDVDPAVVLPVDGRDVDHGRAGGVGSWAAGDLGARRRSRCPPRSQALPAGRRPRSRIRPGPRAHVRAPRPTRSFRGGSVVSRWRWSRSAAWCRGRLRRPRARPASRSRSISASRSARAFVVGQHRGVAVELGELADPAQLGLGVDDQVLVADLHVVGDLRALAAGGHRPGASSGGRAWRRSGGRLPRRSCESRTSRPSRIRWTKRASGRSREIARIVEP